MATEKDQWDSGRDFTSVVIQKGGAGNPGKLFALDGNFDSIAGGGVSVESVFGRNEYGSTEFLRTRVTSDPARVTTTLRAHIKTSDPNKHRKLLKCEHTAWALERCGDIRDLTSWEAAKALFSAWSTDEATSEALAVDTGNPLPMHQFAESAGGQYWLERLRHDNTTLQHSDSPINKVIALGRDRCGGDCGPEDDGEADFGFFTDADTTPGYQGVGTPLFGYTRDGGQNTTFDYINVFQGAGSNAVDGILMGNTVLALSPTHGVAWAYLQDLYDNLTAPWNAAQGLAAGTVIDAAGSTVFVGGTSGRIWRSTDGGRSFKNVVNTDEVTSQNIISVTVVDENIAYFGCANGVLLRYNRGTVSILSPAFYDTDGTTSVSFSSNINALASPPGRDRELYIGGADGHIYHSTTILNNTIKFIRKPIPDAGEGSITALKFTGWSGFILTVLQRNAAGKDRVLWDYSGGDLTNMVRIVGGYTSPGNNNINSIAPVNPNFAMTAGELNLTYAFIGVVHGGG